MTDQAMKEILEYGLELGLSYDQTVEVIRGQCDCEICIDEEKGELAGVVAKAEERLKDVPIGEEVDFDELIQGFYQS